MDCAVVKRHASISLNSQVLNCKRGLAHIGRKPQVGIFKSGYSCAVCRAAPPNQPLERREEKIDQEEKMQVEKADESGFSIPGIDEEEGSNSSPAALIIVGGLLLALIAGGYFYRDDIKEFLQDFSQSLRDMGPSGFVAYAAVYTALEMLAVPAIPLTMTAGLIFGQVSGTAVVSLSGTLAATLAFLVARYLARDKVRKIAYKNPKFAAVDRAIGRNGLKFVTLLRLSPLLPLAASNYVYGLTSVELGPYVLGSWLGMLPGTYAYVNAGHLGRAVIEGGGGEGGGLDPLQVAAGLGTTVLALGFVGQLAKKAVEDEEEAYTQEKAEAESQKK